MLKVGLNGVQREYAIADNNLTASLALLESHDHDLSLVHK